MEDALVPYGTFVYSWLSSRVLILVLMEDALVPDFAVFEDGEV